MQKWINAARRFAESEDGPTAVEYAVMLALILVSCVVLITNVGTTISGTFSKVNSAGFAS